jgi:hypothetical protein
MNIELEDKKYIQLRDYLKSYIKNEINTLKTARDEQNLPKDVSHFCKGNIDALEHILRTMSEFCDSIENTKTS